MSWTAAHLADLVDAKPGFACGEDALDGVFQFRMNNVTTEGTLDLSRRRRVSANSRKLDSFLLQPSDVLFNATNSPELVGKTAFFPGLEEPATYSNHFLRLRPTVAIDGRYLARWLTWQYQRKTFMGLCRQWVNQASVSREALLNLIIPLPPPPEQRRIAAILDQADALRAKRRAGLAELDTLAQSVFIEMFGNSATNPKGFPLGTLGDVAAFVGGGTPSRAVPEYFSGSICWATSKDMKSRFLDDTQEHVTVAAVQASATKVVPPGTVLVVVKSKVLMHRLPVAISRVDTCFGQDLKGIVVDETCLASYVATALRMNASWLLKRARGINTEGLTLDHLRLFPLLLPSKSKQQDFARFADQQELLHQRMSASVDELAALFAALQQRAFQGEL